MKIKDPQDYRAIGKTLFVNHVCTKQSGLLVFAFKTGPRGYVDVYTKSADGLVQLGKHENIKKHRIRANVELVK